MALFETADSTEALLQLFYVAQGKNETGPRPDQLLAVVQEYAHDHPQGHPFTAYFDGREMICPLCRCLPSPFVGDLRKLISEELIAIRDNGCVEVTVLGACLAYVRKLPNSLMELEERTGRLASS